MVILVAHGPRRPWFSNLIKLQLEPPVVCTFVTNHEQVRLCCFSDWLKTSCLLARGTLGRHEMISLQIKNSLAWGKDPLNVCAGIPFSHPVPSVTVTSDASLLGWGAHFSALMADGHHLKKPVSTTICWNSEQSGMPTLISCPSSG